MPTPKPKRYMTRWEAGLFTQADIARRSGVEQGTISKFVRDGLLPKPKHKLAGHETKYWNEAETNEIIAKLIRWRRWQTKNPLRT